MDTASTPEAAESVTQPEATQKWSEALQQYFSAIGFNAGFPLHHHISEDNARHLGQELLRLIQAQQVPRVLFEQTAERLYFLSETIHLSLARTYTLVACALGYHTCVDARKAMLKEGAGVLPPMARRGAYQLHVFAPIQR